MKLGDFLLPVLLCNSDYPPIFSSKKRQGECFIMSYNPPQQPPIHGIDCTDSLLRLSSSPSWSTRNFFDFSNSNRNSKSIILSSLVLLLGLTTTAIVPMTAFAHESITTTANNQNYPKFQKDKSSKNTQNYLPRRLYPGTYKNYCGPTPEVTVKDGCKAHGWHGDEPLDLVDSTCRIHDISYCHCETQLLFRKNKAKAKEQKNENMFLAGNHQKSIILQKQHLESRVTDDNDDSNGDNTNDNHVDITVEETLSDIPLLSALVALRFVTQPLLTQSGTVDSEYLECIHDADTELITSGIRIRREQQQTACQSSTIGDPSLDWFCNDVVGNDNDRGVILSTAKTNFQHLWNNKNKVEHDDSKQSRGDGGGTLSTFENVNMYIFLKNLEADEQQNEDATSHSGKPTLTQLEKQRHHDLLQQIKEGKTVAAAASSQLVEQDEEQLLQKLFLKESTLSK